MICERALFDHDSDPLALYNGKPVRVINLPADTVRGMIEQKTKFRFTVINQEGYYVEVAAEELAVA